MIVGEFTEFLRKIPLFTVHTDEDLAALMNQSELKSVPLGQTIYEQGSQADNFYLVYSGRIRIVQQAVRGGELNLGLRTVGDHFGESGLTTDQPHAEGARAAEDSVVITIPSAPFKEFFFSQPELRECFDEFIRYSSIHRSLKANSQLSSIPAAYLEELAHHSQAELFREGDVVYRQGAAADKLYLIESGLVKVIHWEGQKEDVIAVVRENDFFGEKELVEKTPRISDIICLTDCKLFALNAESFNFLTEKCPELWHLMKERCKLYEARAPEDHFQEIIKQELSARKGMRVEKIIDSHTLAAPEEKKRYHNKLASFFHRHILFPVIMQHDQMTSGSTCLMMIAKYYGKNFSSTRIREIANVDLSGVSLADLATGAEQLGFTTRALSLDYEALRSATLPCIVHWQGNHFIIVYRVNGKHIWVADPAIGLRKYTREYFCHNWKGVTLTCEPTIEFENQGEDVRPLDTFLRFVIPHKIVLIEVFLASLLLNIFGLATPVFTQNIIDKVLTRANASLLNMMLVGMLLVVVFRTLTTILRQYLVIHTGMKIDLHMLVQFYKHLLALPLGYFKVRKIGDFITQFGENRKIHDFMTNTALTLIFDTILILVYIALMAYYSIILTGLVLLLLPAFAAAVVFFTPILKRLKVRAFQANSTQQSHLIESLDGIDTVKAMNTEYSTRWRWENKFVKSLNIDFKLQNSIMYFYSVGDSIGTLGSTLILWYGAHQVMQGYLSVGELVAFMILLGSILAPINRIIAAWDDIQEALVSIEKFSEVFAAEPEFSLSGDRTTGIVLRNPQGNIEFKDVWFRYGGSDNPYILSGITLNVQPGQTLAIVGRSGSGKTTLVRLIARLYTATEGQVKIDGHDTRSLELRQLRKLIGYVPQESFIFDGTVRENISMCDSHESMEQIVSAARLANAHNFISGLSMGYETQIGASGLQLSGGQKQRISIARALYGDPRILILDEATSTVDSESEYAIQQNLEAMIKDKTAIIVAHRLSTVRNADRILVLDNGEVVEQGTHEELMAYRGMYHYLNRQQLNV